MITKEIQQLSGSIGAALISRDTRWRISVPKGASRKFWTALVSYVANECSCICPWIVCIDDVRMIMYTRTHSVLSVHEGVHVRYSMRAELKT